MRRPPARHVWHILLALAALAAAGPAGAQALEFPPLTGRVVDAADLLSPATEAALGRELAEFERQSGGTQIVVATVASLQGQAIEEYGYQLGRHWGIGQRGADTGALLLVAPAERQVRIEVGYGLEGTLTDAISWDIIQGRILPRFRQGEFDAGVLDGTRAIIAALGGEYEPAAAEESDRASLPALVFWVLFVLILLSSFGGGRRGGIGHAVLLGTVLAGGGRGRGGGGGFSGGGGSFGGGGASGGW